MQTTRNQKAKKFKKFLAKNKIKIFHIEEKGDKINTVIFKTMFNIQGQMLSLLFLTDNSIYTLIKVELVSQAANENNSIKLMKYINTLNTTYKIFKYSIDAEGNINLEIPLPYDDKFFDARIIVALMGLTIDNIRETYPKFICIVCKQK